MGHKNKKTLIKQVDEELNSQFDAGKGRQKHIDKRIEGGTVGRIYTDSTLATYKKHACYFVKWAKSAYKCKTLAECRQYVTEWMETRRGLSSWTQKLEAAALAKLYRCSAEELGITTPPRRRKDIKRSRGVKKIDKHFSEKNHAAIVTFGKATGLRRKELSRVSGADLFFKNGRYYLRVTAGTKGGRARTSPITGTPEEVAAVVEMCRKAGNGKVFGTVPKNMDEHGYRREYADRVYQEHKRPLNTLSNDQKYFCRGDMKGIVYDRRALMRVTEALGHARIDVVVSNYAPKP